MFRNSSLYAERELIKEINIDNRAEWNAIVRSFIDYDVYYLAEYVEAFELHGDGIPTLFYFSRDDLRVMNVVMKRDISQCEYFTNLFGLIFSGNSTFQNQMFIQNMLNVENMGDAFKSLVRIIVITLVIEFVGGVFIFFTTSSDLFGSGGSHAFFAIFHSISAFCNAGFSTLGNDNMYHPAFRYAYGFQLVIAILVVFGGIGFGLFLNILQYFKEKFFQGYCQFVKHTPYRFIPKIFSLNTRVVMVTTGILLFLGTIFYFVYTKTFTIFILWSLHSSLYSRQFII